MNEQRINDLKNALREIVQLISSRNEPLSEDLKALLVHVMEHVANRIQQLRQEESQQPVEGLPPGQNLTQNELEPSMPSSNVEGFSYDKDSERLLVRFLGKYPNKKGPIYAYGGVPSNIFEIFKKGAIPAKTDGKNKWGQWWKGKYPSIGAAMYHVIRGGGYPYQRLS